MAKELGIMLMVANLGFCAHIYGETDYIIETCSGVQTRYKNRLRRRELPHGKRGLH